MSGNPRPKITASLLRQVTPNTRFYIDYSWWDEENLDLKTYLLTRLSLGEDFGTADVQAENVDLVDPRTGEVHQVDSFQYLVQSYYVRQSDEVVGQGSIVDAVFSVLLAGGNVPMTVDEIAQRVNRPTELIIKTFSGHQVYNGIRPIYDED